MHMPLPWSLDEDPIDLVNAILNAPEYTEASSSEGTQRQFMAVREAVDRMNSAEIPLPDVTCLTALLSRPGPGTGAGGNLEVNFEVSPHRVYQAATVWRRVSVAMLSVLAYPPVFEYVTLAECVNSYADNCSRAMAMQTGLTSAYYSTNVKPGLSRQNTNATGGGGGGEAGTSSLGLKLSSAPALALESAASCSPLEAVALAVSWVTSIPRVPLSRLQGLCLITSSGSNDPWLEDTHCILQGRRAVAMVSDIKDMLAAYRSRDTMNSQSGNANLVSSPDAPAEDGLQGSSQGKLVVTSIPVTSLLGFDLTKTLADVDDVRPMLPDRLL
jgi:hypothetical protein